MKPVALAVGTLLFAAAAFAAWYALLPIDTGQYPSLLDAYDLAPAERKPAMREVVQEAARFIPVTFTRYSRDRFLAAGGYCASLPVGGCRPAPKGTEAQGLAIERFGYVARWGTSHAQEEPCHPRRCGPAPSDIIAAPAPPPIK